MKVPHEFEDLTSRFHQGSLREAGTDREWVRIAVRYLGADQKRIVRKFLNEVLNGEHDEADLQRIWNSSRADYLVTGESGGRDLLTMIRDEI